MFTGVDAGIIRALIFGPVFCRVLAGYRPRMIGAGHERNY